MKLRLLQVDNNGELSLVERSAGNIPKYAILSYTWGLDGDGVNRSKFT
jgi:hypothetical protein